jgi:hypothetical protein
MEMDNQALTTEKSTLDSELKITKTERDDMKVNLDRLNKEAYLHVSYFPIVDFPFPLLALSLLVLILHISLLFLVVVPV